ncbi:spermatogenesis-associated protein 1-like isoform X5 [Babylonia areolata]|uniref:spermatogenesis-associated protein 1-like isoform X5 n=1 Tax=Babylonia areolata TaxID=304850 RepID=UPI003FCF0710
MSRVSSFPSRPPSRPSSEQLCDLHVYQVPWSLWREPLNNLLNQSVADTVSLGIIRVHPDVPLVDLRQEIQRQLEEMAPKEYVFLRSVGRSLTRLKKKQEYQLKARDFLSPKYYAPELYILEATQEMQDAFAASERSSQQSRGSPGSRSYRNGYRSDRDRNGYPGFSPEDQYKNRDKENYYDAANSKARDLQNRLNREQFNLDDDEDHKRRLRELEDGALMDSEHWARDQDERRRRAEEERHRTEEDKRREEERRKAEEEEEKRRRQKEEEEERRRREEEERRKSSDEDLNRFPSPPPLRMSPGDVERDSQSAQQRWREEKQKLLQEIEEARETRQMTEKEREELVKKAKALQTKTQNRRNQARDTWKKRYFEEKKKTPPLEEQTNRLKEELEGLHRKLMTVLEGPKEKNIKLGDSRPSQKNNYVIQCTRLQHDIDDLKRRIENAKMKLTAEMKLRNQAEMELRSLRAELVQKKINLSLVRSQQFAALSSGLSESTPVPDIPTGKRDEQSVTV